MTWLAFRNGETINVIAALMKNVFLQSPLFSMDYLVIYSFLIITVIFFFLESPLPLSRNVVKIGI